MRQGLRPSIGFSTLRASSGRKFVDECREGWTAQVASSTRQPHQHLGSVFFRGRDMLKMLRLLHQHLSTTDIAIPQQVISPRCSTWCALVVRGKLQQKIIRSNCHVASLLRKAEHMASPCTCTVSMEKGAIFLNPIKRCSTK